MGFGYLFLGYLVTFVLYLTIQALGFGGFGLLIGYGLMLCGARCLYRYQRAFAYAKWALIPLLVTAVYESARNLAELFLWNTSLFDGVWRTVYSWAVFLLLLFFNLAMLYGIRSLARDVGLPRIVSAAIRNSIFVVLYGVLYLVGNFPVFTTEQVRAYLGLPMVLTQMVFVFCNLFLILTCAKDICPEGEEDQAPKRYRWEWLNRVGDTYERTRKRTEERTKEDLEAVLRKQKEKRKSRSQAKKKK